MSLHIRQHLDETVQIKVPSDGAVDLLQRDIRERLVALAPGTGHFGAVKERAQHFAENAAVLGEAQLPARDQWLAPEDVFGDEQRRVVLGTGSGVEVEVQASQVVAAPLPATAAKPASGRCPG